MLALRPYHCVLRGPLVLSGRGSAASACWITHFTAAGRRGTLASGELAAYTEQYRRIEAALPEVLRRVASNLPDGPARAAVHANLSDELGRPAPAPGTVRHLRRRGRPRRLDGQRAGRHRRQLRAGDQRGSRRSPRMVAVPRRTPNHGVDHRPRDHRDAGLPGPAARRRLPRDASGGEVLLAGEAPRVPIKIPSDGNGHVRSVRIAPDS